MSKAYSNLKPNISVENSPVFSACFAAGRIAPVSALLISGLPEERFDLTLEIKCSHNGQILFAFVEKNFKGINARNYGYSSSGRMIIRFSFEDFTVNYELLKALESAFDETITVSITVDGNRYDTETPVRILPANDWAGAEYHPETLACFVTPAAAEVAGITASVPVSETICSYEECTDILGAIIKNIRGKNIVCAKRDSYSPEKSQTIKTADMLSSKSSVVATPVELAVLFSACAYKCGLNPVIVFTKNTMGVTSVFCGVSNFASRKSAVIFESLTGVRHALENREMILFDPAIMSSAQSVEVTFANEAAAGYMHKTSTDMIFGIDVASSFKSGVAPLYGAAVRVSGRAKEPREELARLYTGLVNRPVFRMLGGEYGGYDVIPLIGAGDAPAADAVVVRPLEISEKIDGYSGLADGFASFALKDVKPKKYNKAELEQTEALYASFRQRMSSKKNAVAGIYEKTFHERISRMTFGNAHGMSNYMICGFVRLTDAQSGETRYLPASFKKIKLGCRYDYCYSEEPSRLIVNTVLISYLSRHEIDLSETDTPAKVYDLFERLTESVKRRERAFSDIKFIREYALIKADLSDYILWNDMKLYGRSMLSNNSLGAVLTCNCELLPKEEPSDGGVLPIWTSVKAEEALRYCGNTIISGSSVTEKTDAAVNKVLQTLTSSGTVLVASSNQEFLDEMESKMNGYGLGDAVLRLSGSLNTSDLVGMIKEKLSVAEEYQEEQQVQTSSESKIIKERIEDFCELINYPDNEMGTPFIEAVKSYYSAIDAPGGKIDTLLEVKKEAFGDLSEKKLNLLFEKAENLVNCASEAQKTAELPINTPIKDNPLFLLEPKTELSENQLQEVFELIARILTVLSDYRDNFYDISEELGIGISDIRTLSGVYSLNELYKLIISARELDIPADFSKQDISGMADGAGALEKSRQRIENIEYRLRFFLPELFEDVDTLLSGYNYSEDEQRGFIKKFLVRKNNKDILLQYVAPEKKNEFYQHDTEEIYKLLNEYRQLKTSLSENNSAFSTDENGVRLAALAREANKLLCEIYPELGDNVQLRNKKAGKVFDFILKVTDDAVISKKLTYARAKFAQVYSDNDCMISRLSDVLGADFTKLSFDNGFLAYDGFGEYLRTLEKNLPLLSCWIRFLNAKKEADEFYPAFTQFITHNGITENTDRIFAASLIIPAIGHFCREYDITKNKAVYDTDFAEFAESVAKERELALASAVASLENRLKKFVQEEDLTSIEADSALSLCAFVNKNKKALFGIYPCILAESTDVGAFFEGERVADLLVCDENEKENPILLTAVASAGKTVAVQYSTEYGYIGKRLKKLGAASADVSYHVYPADRKLCTLLGNGMFVGKSMDDAVLSVVTVNGTMRRAGDSANPAEAEVCVSKALELVAKGESSIGIFAVTPGQYAYIKHLLYLNTENDKLAAEAVAGGKIKVVDASQPSFEKFENVLVSLGAAADKNGNIGWSFGCGTDSRGFDVLNSIANSSSKNTVLVTSLTIKEFSRLSQTSTEARKLYTAVLAATQGVVPAEVSALYGGENTFMHKLLADYPDAVPAKGLYECGADAVDVASGKALIIDCDIKEHTFDKLSATERFAQSGTEYEVYMSLEEALNKAI